MARALETDQNEDTWTVHLSFYLSAYPLEHRWYRSAGQPADMTQADPHTGSSGHQVSSTHFHCER